MTEVAAYPLALIEQLLDWCATRAGYRPAAVAAIGLAYGFGLNEHQIAVTRIVATEPSVTAAFPLARRAAEIPRAGRRTIALEHPDWLAAAVRTLIEGATERPGSLLFRSASPIGIPRSPGWVRSLIAVGSAEATGHRLSCTGLARTRLVDAAVNGHPLAPYQIGFAPSWEARLVDPVTIPRLPQRG